MTDKTPHEVLTNQIEKVRAERVASYAVRVERVMTRAEERVIALKLKLQEAEETVAEHKKAMEAFKEGGDVKHLRVFGINGETTSDDGENW